MLTNENKILNLESMVDFTLLDPRATEFDLEKMCDIAYKHSYYSVCVNSCNVAYVKNYIIQNLNNSLKVVSVVGFPLGANTIEAKVFCSYLLIYYLLFPLNPLFSKYH